MKALSQLILIAGGCIGLLISLPIAYFAWRMRRGFGVDLTSGDLVLLYSPIACFGAAAIGIMWRRRSG